MNGAGGLTETPPAAAAAADRESASAALRVLVATALAYGLVGWGSVLLAIPPSYASPFFPSAGVALACVVRCRLPALAGVLIGSFLINAALAHQRGTLSAATAGLALIIGCGAALQAGVGAALLRRFLPGPLTLSTPREVTVFAAGAFGACVVSASIATVALGASGVIASSELALTWGTWWLGDALGVLITAPAVLTLIGRPHDAWRSRRLTVGLPLTVLMALLALFVLQVARWDDERVRGGFERDATAAATLAAERLGEPLGALQALHSVYVASERVDAGEFARASGPWLERVPSLQALGWAERVPRADVAAFEAVARPAGAGTPYRVFDHAPGAPGDDVVAVRFIEPMRANAALPGLNLLSIPQARAAFEAAQRRADAVASAGFVLPRQEAADDRRSVLVMRAVYRGRAATPAERVAATQGVVVALLRLDEALHSLLADAPGYLNACILDAGAQAVRTVLFGPAGCQATPAGHLLHVRALPFAGQHWELRLSAAPRAAPGAEHVNAWLLSLVGLVATAMLSMLLLGVTGRTRRIQTAVQERTMALMNEIRDREQTARALRDSETRFRNIFNNVPIGVLYTDLDGNVKHVNPRFCELVGHDADVLATMNVADFTHSDDRAQGDGLTRRLVAGDLPMYRRQERCVASDGRVVQVRSVVTLLRDAQGVPHRIVRVAEDITEHLRLEEAERAREVAESSNLAKSEFLSRMSHELRTPLNAMLGFAQLLEMDRRQPLSPTQRPWVAQIQSAGWHLLEMINDVLDLSRIEAGTFRLTSTTLDLGELLASTRPLVDAAARARGIVITQAIAPDAIAVLGDVTRVKQILTNLLTNAVKYNHDGGRIHVAARALDDEHVEISVTDTGLGMTPGQLADLFQPFNRLGRERSQQEGTGIGLVISRRLAELMGGSLQARSVTGEGSCFLLVLPRVVEPDTVRSALDAPPDAEAVYHHRIVHYVEDNETNVEVMRGILAQRPQVRFDVSMTGLDGLAAIRAHQPDLVLLDLHLPDIDGMELLRRLRADEATARIPVVIVSADALPAQIQAAIDAGADGYLTKPVSVAEVLGHVDRTLDWADTRPFQDFV